MAGSRSKGKGVLRRTIELPAKLRTELEALGSLPQAHTHKSRNERRKQLRTHKQAHSPPSKLEYTPSNTGFPSLDQKRASADVPATRAIKKARRAPAASRSRGAEELVNTAALSSSTSSAAHGTPQATRRTPLEKLLSKQEKRDSAPDLHRTKPRLVSVEDREIAWLAAKLGIHRDSPISRGERSNVKKEFEEDGLGGEPSRCPQHASTQTASESGFEHEGDVHEDVNERLNDGTESESDGESFGENRDVITQWDVTSATVASDEFSSGSSMNAAGPAPPAPTARYVPPQLRNLATNVLRSVPVSTPVTAPRRTDEPPADSRIRRQLLGHLNRLSSSNMMPIIDAISAIYDTNPRALVSNAFSSLLLETISTRDNLGDQLLITYAALVAAMAYVVGLELSAGVVSKTIELFDASYNEGTDTSSTERPQAPSQPVAFEGRPGSKTCLNLTAFLAELYNFSVVGCTIVYDIIRFFIKNGLGELDVELLSRLMKSELRRSSQVARCCATECAILLGFTCLGSGSHLRQDDPSALKEIVALVKEQAVLSDVSSSMNSRTKFMLEMLTDVKNNKLKSDFVGTNDGYSSLKKLIASLGKMNSSYHEPLRITLSDIRNSSSRGKWWLVGAAWAGIAEAEVDTSCAGPPGGQRSVGLEDGILKLARAHGMNTDVRRTIFVILMSGEDYADACDRLLQLGLTDVQQREIVRVLLRCSGNERRYNPYYTLVSAELAKRSHGFRITLQYCLWDFLRELGKDSVGREELVKSIDMDTTGGTVSPRRVHNLARLYAWCIAKDALSLTVLKPVSFATIKTQTTDFLQQLFVTMIIATQTASPALVLPALEGRRDRKVIEKLCVRAATNGSLVKGLLHFLEAAVTEDVIRSNVRDDTAAAVARFGVALMQDTLSAL
ncbi:BQ5605_C051g12533 [Microbotryum silenes-dioicae]|uniref:BQ5605_C051g12533 protein n=1 Tax=Microbotryum silenes-dioicae TaxID=796604 RepID=A0A2X0PMV7_9BASI|nr:BQ5605_C051g12533 [Microbotryum silenes-dioicae]